MNYITRQLIQSSGGSFNYFFQGEYIEGNKWNVPDNRQRQGAWLGDSYDGDKKIMIYGLGGGVCRGLAGAYLVAGVHWSIFQTYIRSERGRILVRGVTNFQEQLSKIGKTDKLNESFYQILKTSNVNLVKKHKIARKNIPYSKSVGDEILKHICSGFLYNISFDGPWGGHSLGMRIERGDIKLFDPNIGEVTYPYEQGRNQAVSHFFDHLCLEYYNPLKSILIERYASH